MKAGSKPDIKVFSRNLFADFDKNKDGFITFDEFRRVKNLINKSLTDENLKIEFDKFDNNKSGKVSLKGYFKV